MRSHILTRRPAASSPFTQTRLLLIAGIAISVLAGSTLLAQPTSGGYIAKVANTNNSAGTAQNFSCVDSLAVDKASAVFSYELNEPSGSIIVTDYASGLHPGAFRGAMASSPATPIACPRDAGGAYILNGSTDYVSAPVISSGLAQFSLEVWFKTTVASGKLIGFGNQLTGASSRDDRHLYISTAGNIVFGVYNAGPQTIVSPLAYNDGLWHQAVATFSGATGMTLYMDGKNVVTNAANTTADSTMGYWRLGYDNLAGWPLTGSNYFFTGSLRFAAVYSTVLTIGQITNHFAAGQ